ncbi:hypothetical protein V8B55DRAFT_1032959 [Mucor lusitanicus]
MVLATPVLKCRIGAYILCTTSLVLLLVTSIWEIFKAYALPASNGVCSLYLCGLQYWYHLRLECILVCCRCCYIKASTLRLRLFRKIISVYSYLTHLLFASCASVVISLQTHVSSSFSKLSRVYIRHPLQAIPEHYSMVLSRCTCSIAVNGATYLFLWKTYPRFKLSMVPFTRAHKLYSSAFGYLSLGSTSHFLPYLLSRLAFLITVGFGFLTKARLCFYSNTHGSNGFRTLASSISLLKLELLVSVVNIGAPLPLLQSLLAYQVVLPLTFCPSISFRLLNTLSFIVTDTTIAIIYPLEKKTMRLAQFKASSYRRIATVR